jgi:hypothetical protein
MVGSMYSLTCIVTGAERLTDSTIDYQWLKDGETVTEETNKTLSFTVLTLSDTGSYTCQATVISSLLSAPINSTSTAFTCELQRQINFIRYDNHNKYCSIRLVSDLIMSRPTTDPPSTTVSNPVVTKTVSSPPSKFSKIYNRHFKD